MELNALGWERWGEDSVSRKKELPPNTNVHTQELLGAPWEEGKAQSPYIILTPTTIIKPVLLVAVSVLPPSPHGLERCSFTQLRTQTLLN